MRRAALLLGVALAPPLAAQREARITLSEFIYNSAPFPSAHASTIEETGGVLAAAWFGGSSEGAADVGIWLSRKVDGKWTAPVEVANGAQGDGKQLPCWNPVLFKPKTGALTPTTRSGRVRESGGGRCERPPTPVKRGATRANSRPESSARSRTSPCSSRTERS